MTELDRSAFRDARPFFLGHRQYAPALAVLEDTLPGRVFVDTPDEPRVVVAWAITWWAYIEGRGSAPPDAAGRLSAFLRDVVLPGTRELGMNWFELYAPNDADWMEACERAFGSLDESDGPKLKTDRHLETTYFLDEERFEAALPALVPPTGVILEHVEIPLLSRAARELPVIPPDVRDRTTPGFRLVIDERVAALCKAYGFASDGSFMLAVDTYSEQDRGKGYASIVSAALIQHALERGMKPLWETTEWNEPSQRVAAKLGFVPDETYPVYGVVWEPPST